MADLGEIRVIFKAEGVDEVAGQMEEVQGGGLLGGGMPEAPSDGGGGMQDMMNPLEGIMSSIMGMSKLMMGILGAVVGVAMILMSMEPIQKMMKAFMNVIQAFFLPLAMLLIKLLSPVLRFMMKLLPFWLSFWDDPIGNLKELMKLLWEFMKDLPGMIWDLMKALPRLYWELIQKLAPLIWDFMKDLPGMIWDLMQKLPLMIADWIGRKLGLGGIPEFQTGGVVGQTGLARVHRGEAVIPRADFNRLLSELRGRGGTKISISGGLEPFIERVERDMNVRR